VITELASGFFISEVVLPGLGIKTINDRAWRSVHNLTLNYTVLFAGLHIAINWDWISSVFKKKNRANSIDWSFSPKIMTMLLRISFLILAAGIVTLVLFSLIGKPSPARLYSQNEIARFHPSFGHGIVQFLGEALLILVVAFISRKWFRVRL